MSFTKDDLDTLDEAIKKGVKKVDYPGGHSIEYQSVSDMLKARRAIILEMNSTMSRKPYSLADFR